MARLAYCYSVLYIINFAICTAICGFLGEKERGNWAAWIFAISMIIETVKLIFGMFAMIRLNSLVGGILGFSFSFGDILSMILDVVIPVVEMRL